MTTALRIGVIVGGRLVEERLVRRGEVTIGQSARCTLAVPVASLPRRLVLFEPTTAGWRLRPFPGMESKLADEGARGKVLLGEVTVLFQHLAAPARAPRPRLPPSVRSSLVRTIDWVLASVVVGSFLVHFGCVGYLRSLDFPKKPDVEEAPEFAVFHPRLRIETPKPDVPVKPEKVAATPAPGARARSKPESAADAEVRRARMTDEIHAGLLKILVAKGDGKEGALHDVLHGGDVSSDADEVFRKVGGVGVQSASDNRLYPRGASTGSVRGSSDLKFHGPAAVASGDKGREHEVAIKESAPTEIEGPQPPDPTRIAGQIRGFLGGVRACYEEAMRHDEGLAGKVILRFDILSTGRVREMAVQESTLPNDAMIPCLRARALQWRFLPSVSAYSFSYPFVFIKK